MPGNPIWTGTWSAEQCRSWLSLGFAYGHEIPVACERPCEHNGDHTGVKNGQRFTWRVYYSRWVNGKAVKA